MSDININITPPPSILVSAGVEEPSTINIGTLDNHNNLYGLQGGSTFEYYHLNKQQYDLLGGDGSLDFVTLTGDQSISGIKSFNSRPTVFGTGVMLSGEAAPLPTTIVYQTGDQTISGNKSFIDNVSIGFDIVSPQAKLDILDTVLAGSAGLSGSALNIAQTWNTTGAPTAIKLDVTDTGGTSNAASKLLDMQVSGVSRFSVNKAGGLTFNPTSPSQANPQITLGGGNRLYTSGTTTWIGNGSGTLGSLDNTFGIGTSSDLFITRDAANTLAQRNGTNAQTFRLYNTYSSSTNFERLNFRWSGNTAFIGTEKGSAGGTARDLVLETNGTERVRVSAAGVFSVDGILVWRGSGNASTNTAVGQETLFDNTTGTFNTAVGRQAIANNTIGAYNTAVGANAMFINTTGSVNVAVGQDTLRVNTTGAGNTAVGANALNNNTTGSLNTAIGYIAARFIADGTTSNTVANNSVYLGAETKALASGQTNQIVIGYSAIGLGSNTAVLGNDSIVTTALKGNVGIGTTSPASKLTVTDGDIEATDSTKGVILKSPNGTRYRITVDDTGVLITTSL